MCWQTTNAELQRRLAAYLAGKKSEEGIQSGQEEGGEHSAVDLEQRYFTGLRQVPPEPEITNLKP